MNAMPLRSLCALAPPPSLNDLVVFPAFDLAPAAEMKSTVLAFCLVQGRSRTTQQGNAVVDVQALATERQAQLAEICEEDDAAEGGKQRARNLPEVGDAAVCVRS
jgi:hypothetical protein